MRIGFVGLGTMGQPMALRLAAAGVPLVVWNRSPGPLPALAAAGAIVAEDVDALFAAAEVVILMLADEQAVDAVLGRGTPGFAARVAGRLLVPMGTTSPGYSRGLADDVATAGGRYVEAPVSGSRVPAEAGQLVAMLAGRPEDVVRVRDLVRPMCKEAFPCGAVPQAQLMKLAVNLHLITAVTGLCEAAHFAREQGLDLRRFTDVIAAGPLANVVTATKLPKLVAEDFAVQASLADVHHNCRLVAGAARAAGVAHPLLEAATALYAEATRLVPAPADMVGVVRAIEARTTDGRSARAAFLAGLPPPAATAAGCMWLPRLMAKARAHLAGTLPADYAGLFCHPQGMDGRFLATFGLTREAVLAAAARPAADDEAWFLGLPGVGADGIAAWNDLAPNLGRPGFPMAGELAWARAHFRPDLAPALVPTVFALLERDEGRPAGLTPPS